MKTKSILSKTLYHLFVLISINTNFPFPCSRVALETNLRPAFALQIVLNVVFDVIPHFQCAKQRECVRLFRPFHSSHSILIAPPRLRLDHQRDAQSMYSFQKAQQAIVAVVQMNPHRDRHATDDIESIRAIFGQMSADAIVASTLVHDVDAMVEHTVWMLVVFAGAFDQRRVDVNAENDDFLFHSLAQELVQQLREIARVAADIQHKIR